VNVILGLIVKPKARCFFLSAGLDLVHFDRWAHATGARLSAQGYVCGRNSYDLGPGRPEPYSWFSESKFVIIKYYLLSISIQKLQLPFVGMQKSVRFKNFNSLS